MINQNNMRKTINIFKPRTVFLEYLYGSSDAFGTRWLYGHPFGTLERRVNNSYRFIHDFIHNL